MNDSERLENLIKGHHPCITVITHEEAFALELIRDAALRLKWDMALWTITSGVRDGLFTGGPAVPESEHPAAAIFHLARQDKKFIAVALDLIEHLKDARTVRVLRDLIYQFEQTGSTLIMIDSRDELPSVIQSHATRFDISLPDAEELENIVLKTLRSFHQEKPIEVNITRAGLKTIIRNLRGLTRRQARQIILDAVAEDRRFDASDINTVLARKRQMLQGDGLLEYIEVPVDLNEIGGLARLKAWLKQRQDAMSDGAVEFGISAPRGVLMLGVQGAGKSLCAKAIATAWQRPLLRMDPAALYDRYIGESEKRLRMSLRQAEMMAPIILWIDEIEKAFASAASRSTDGGLSQRMFGTLLTWMQEHTEPVFLVATANDIEALPPELLRKGRFDEIFFVDLPGAETRMQIFAIHLRKHHREPDQFDLEALGQASEGYSGAEIEQAVISALHEAYADGSDLNDQLLLNALKNSPPLSVTMREHILQLQQWAQHRCVPAE